MDERTGLWSRRGFKAQCLQIIVLITTALGFLNSSGSAAQESPIVLFGIEAVERALSSFDKDLKFAALASVQRGLVRDVVTAQVLFVDAAKGTRANHTSLVRFRSPSGC